jgi:hypothetical protein
MLSTRDEPVYDDSSRVVTRAIPSVLGSEVSVGATSGAHGNKPISAVIQRSQLAHRSETTD